MKLVHIDSSARLSSVSRQLTASFVAAWKLWTTKARMDEHYAKLFAQGDNS